MSDKQEIDGIKIIVRQQPTTQAQDKELQEILRKAAARKRKH